MPAIFLITALMLWSVHLSQSPQDPSKTTAQARAAQSPDEQVAAIKKEYAERQNEFFAASRAAKDQVERAKVSADYTNARQECQKKLSAVLQAHPEEPAAFEAILFLAEDLSFVDDPMRRITLQHHQANPRLGRLCLALMRQYDQETEKLIKDLATKHADRAIRGVATYSLGKQAQLQLNPWGQKLSESDRTKLKAMAERFFKEAAKEYGDVTLPESKDKLAAKAANELIRLKNMGLIEVGKVAPEIVGEDLDGKAMKLSDYRGKVVLLDFWGNW